MARQTAKLFTREIVTRATIDSFKKLDPRVQLRNPVMFVVEVGSVITTATFFINLIGGGGQPLWFTGDIAVWLWLTVLFANFAEAIAEGRGKAQADTLRAMRTTTLANRRRDDGAIEQVPAAELQRGDVVVVEAGEAIPADGDVIEGIGSVDESAITGESAPVIRESGGDRSAVTGGTRLLSDRLVVQVTQEPGKSFLDRMISLVEGAERRKTPNEIALNILLAGLTLIFLVAVVTLQPFALYAQERRLDHGADLPAGRADPHHHRRAALVHRHRRHGPAGAPQRARAVRPRGRGLRRHRRAAARQDRHDHARQPPGGRVHPRARASSRTTWPRPPSSRRWPTRRPRAARSSSWPSSSASASTSSRRSRPSSCPFSATTRMSGVNMNGTMIRKGATDAVRHFVEESGGRVPAEVDAAVERIAREGGTPLVVARDNWTLGVIYLKDIVKGGIKERFDELRKMGIRTVMITGDNPVTAAYIANESGVDDFLAEATPENKMALIKEEQGKGRMVAMTGDGTNDAPALAQADVGVAMNTGTQAAKEAGNMVDLDSNPTKLIEIVEVGKQLLITRGALTTFSIANDVAKYFAILPAMFAYTYAAQARRARPAVDDQHHEAGHAALARSPRRSSSTRCHPDPDPAVAARRPLPGDRRDRAPAPQHADLRAGRHHRAVHRHQADRPRRPQRARAPDSSPHA